MRNLIIDTDIGDDADDVLALAFALQHPELNIKGVTTVFKNTALRAKIARYTLDLFGRNDIPVGAGAGMPLNNPVDINERPCQFLDVMQNIDAPQLIAKEIFNSVLSKQQTTLVCIGPLTNIAKLIKEQSHLLHNIEEIIIMGGCYYQHGNEWNIVCDAEAADIVFRSGLPLRCIGLDVTRNCHLGPWLGKISTQTERNRYLLKMCQKWFDKSGFTPILHDPLTIFSCLANNSLRFRPERVTVELQGAYTRGMTYTGDYRIWNNSPPESNATVAYEVDTESFVEYFVTKTFSR